MKSVEHRKLSRAVEEAEQRSEFGLFGVDFFETKRMMNRLLKPYGLSLKIRTRENKDDQSRVWIVPIGGADKTRSRD